MSRFILFTLALFFLVPAPPLGAEMLQLRHSRSVLLTEGIPDIPFGHQSSPVVIETEVGYCAAWIDGRQGGATMAARIDRTGALRDPFGIPMSRSLPSWQYDIISRDGRCMVIHGDGNRVVGTAIAADGPAEPASIFILEPGAPWQVTEADDAFALISGHHPWGLQLTLVDADGDIQWSHPVETGYYQLRAVIRDTTALVLVQPANRSGDLTLWRVDEEGATPFETDVLSSEIYHWGVVDEGDSLLVIDLDPADEGGPIRLDRITEEGEQLVSWFPENTPPAWGIEQLWREDDGTVRALLNSQGLYLLTITGEETEVELISETRDAAIAGDPRLSIWQGLSVWHLRYGFGLPASVPGQPLTTGKRLEIVADAAATQDGIAVVWVEWSPTTPAQALKMGFIDPVDLRLRGVETVSDGEIIGGTANPANRTRAAVTSKGSYVQIAWIEGTELRTRRRNLDGTWAGDVQTISTGALTLDADGLIPVDDGVFLVWTDYDTADVRLSVTRGAWVGDDGTIEMADLPSLSHEGEPAWPAALMIGGRLVVAVSTPISVICEFTCPGPNYRIHVLQETSERKWSTVQTPELVLGQPPAFAADEDSLLVVDPTGAGTFRLSGGALVTERQFGDYYPRYPRAIVWRTGFVSAGRHEPDPRGGWIRETRVVTLDGSKDLARVQSRIPDIGDLYSFHFVPALIEWNDRIYVISSEVSRVPEEGSVRRLRIHELEPVGERRRTIRRR